MKKTIREITKMNDNKKRKEGGREENEKGKRRKKEENIKRRRKNKLNKTWKDKKIWKTPEDPPPQTEKSTKTDAPKPSRKYTCVGGEISFCLSFEGCPWNHYRNSVFRATPEEHPKCPIHQNSDVAFPTTFYFCTRRQALKPLFL